MNASSNNGSSSSSSSSSISSLLAMMTSTVIGMDTMDMILKDPETLFKYLAGTLVTIGITLKVWPYLKSYTGTNSISIGSDKNKKDNQKNQKPLEIQSLQRRFLPVFFLFRMSFWMAGPYFFQVYSSKTFALSGSTSSNITPEATTKEFVRRISLVGYLAILLLSPLTGKFTEKYGLKTATICAGIMYLVGSISVFSNTSLYLYAGRAIGSVASPWLCSAPESWLIGEFLIIQKRILDKKEKENASSSSNKKKKKKMKMKMKLLKYVGYLKHSHWRMVVILSLQSLLVKLLA
jgi:hypothetical protein